MMMMKIHTFIRHFEIHLLSNLAPQRAIQILTRTSNVVGFPNFAQAFTIDVFPFLTGKFKFLYYEFEIIFKLTIFDNNFIS